MTRHDSPRRQQAAQAALWVPGLLVALGAGVATAHGLYEVALAAEVPAPIAWLYPLITDGLALVAYATTARLAGRERRYAWTVVVLAAGLSGLAQATYLAGGLAAAPVPLRFGIGAWPAIAAAVVAHLLYLIATAHHDETDAESTEEAQNAPRDEAATESPVPVAESAAPVEARSEATGERATVQTEPVGLDASTRVNAEPVQPASVQPAFNDTEHAAVQPSAPVQPEPVRSRPETPHVHPSPGPSSAGGRAERTARAYAARHGDWPTVSALVDAAEVSRGTAAAALKSLRETPAPLHIVPEQTPNEAHS